MMLVASVGDQKGEGKGCLSVSCFFEPQGNGRAGAYKHLKSTASDFRPPEVHLLRPLSLREVSWSELRPVGRSCQSEEVYGGEHRKEVLADGSRATCRLSLCLFSAFRLFCLGGLRHAFAKENRKSLENSSLTDAAQFCRSGFLLRQNEVRRGYFRAVRVKTKHNRKSARQNRQGLNFRQLVSEAWLDVKDLR